MGKGHNPLFSGDWGVEHPPHTSPLVLDFRSVGARPVPP